MPVGTPPQEQFGRRITRQQVPSNMDAEKGVLSSILSSPAYALTYCSNVTAAYFCDERNALIFEQLAEAGLNGKAVDLIGFCERLEQQDLLNRVGGRTYVTHLLNFVPSAAAIESYIEILRDKHILREVISVATAAIKSAQASTESEPIISSFEQAVLGIRPPIRKETIAISALIGRAIESIERAYERKGTLSGLATGFIGLDKMTGGLNPGDMVVVAGRPSMGKTALSMNIAEHVALESKIPVLVDSYEMSADQLVQRLICSRARVNLQKVRDGFLSERDFPSITSAASKLGESKMFINEDADATIEAVCANARQIKHRYGIGLIVVDYIQLLSSSVRHRDRQSEMTTISRRLKKLAKELEVPIIVLCQLNRKPEERGGKPRLSDLRESGSIEQDADIVGLLWRPEIYEQDDELKAEMSGEAQLIIAKQRNGPVGEIPLTFLKEFTRFEDRAGIAQQEQF